MPPKSKKPTSGLGRAVIKSRFQGQKAIAVDEGRLHTTDTNEGPNWVKMQSITQENDLDAFLSTAALAEADFTAERLNVKVIQDNYQSTPLLSDQEEKKRLKKQAENVDRLSVPRRPFWEKTMTAEEVQRNERESFLDWRRGLAELEQDEDLVLTPFEKNIEVWRQLWRVVERSQLIVQIVDARNPLVFRSADLDKYVQEVDPIKKNLLLINKADFLTAKQRRAWADYLDANDIRYTFFSAALAAKKQEAEKEAHERAELEKSMKVQSEDESSEDEQTDDEDISEQLSKASLSASKESNGDGTDKSPETSKEDHGNEKEQENEEDDRIRIRTTTDLLDLLLAETPKMKDAEGGDSKIVIGLVGYPNVGKSSTINTLLGEKRVSVSSTPGKTKHFQTIHLTSNIVLCDCPGLVFPTFSTTKADQVCNGVLPIDQLRDHTGPTALIAKRIPQPVLEAIYGIRIRTVPKEDGGSGIPTSAELCSTYAIARGYFRSSQGTPDEARAARYILKDYVNGKLIYCHPPPEVDGDEFNEETHAGALKVQKKLAPTTRVPASALNYVAPSNGTKTQAGSRTEALDKAFFKKDTSAPRVQGKHAVAIPGAFSRVTLYPHQKELGDDGMPLPQGRRERLAMVQRNQEEAGPMSSKKHKKGKKNVKARSGAGYDFL